jgi:GntR family transcriptional repressor for pyruvate dehydrogenase complex
LYSQKECLDLFEVLHILQVAAVSLAAKTISPSYITLLEENIRRSETAKNPAEYFRLNRDFHMIIARGTNNEALAEYIENVYSRLFLFDFAKNPKMDIPTAIEQHKLLLDAIRKQDENAAVEIHVHHAKVTGNYMNWALYSQNNMISNNVL